MTTNKKEKTPLKFRADGKFKIVIFSDVQDKFPVHQRVISIMEQALEREKPDFVVFLGDQTEMNTKDPQVDFRRTIRQILEPVVRTSVPYAFVFGNHDDQCYYIGTRADKKRLLSVYQSIGDCRTYDANPNLTGAGTCKLPIYASDGSGIVFLLWMVDSNTYQNPITEQGGYDNPHADQLAWMKANNDAGVNSLVFQHIPMPEIYNLLLEDENGTKIYGGKKYAKALNINSLGSLGEFPCPCNAENDMGEFATLKEMGNVLGVFTGHDHLNDFIGTYDGIDMLSVPGMTYFNYGDEAVRGYGVIELRENNLSNYDYHSVKFSMLDTEVEAFNKTLYDGV
ncbi:MAG: metallophosphoesterase [Oscillospiraceae bacterium]|nr:metallophosphoesterase [Oscillospiraceae bacterium]